MSQERDEDSAAIGIRYILHWCDLTGTLSGTRVGASMMSVRALLICYRARSAGRLICLFVVGWVIVGAYAL